MTAEFGPLNDDHERSDGVPDALGALALKITLASIELVTNTGPKTKYNIEKNRLSLHGERKHPGRAFDGGLIVAHLIGTTCANLIATMWIVAEVAPTAAGTPLAPVSFAFFVWSFGLGLTTLWGVVGRIKSLNVLDHTTPKPDERIDELADGYVDGDLDREEFAQEVETVFERETD